ncbi:MAG: prolyl oligopeptidase family serine peptidase [Cypionkella sp.]|uniref:prolyl oligopeptidase family serine peptidase n=1 Tax=Cypionkella sp. TaxID=2811411 RepID=UPI002ABAE1BD|nr:prolyl oligopeptidase family serine peptidase [Cypionkella sp.]MDZ4310722.1 prolyl oligopeptidase family serine peptidase [Cypionkella sp.]
MTPLEYPQTQHGDVVDQLFGVAVADPYRWLETEASNDAGVADWVAAQNKVTNTYLATLPGREVFRERLNALYSSDFASAPFKRGDLYFYIHQAGLVNQPSLMVRDDVDGPDRVLIDPNTWSDDGATALAEWSPSQDGSLMAYAVQDGGTDWRTINVLDVATGEVLQDKVERARFTTIEWAKDGTGFFYGRYADPEAGASAQVGVVGHSVYFHALGTPQTEDRLLYATPDKPSLLQVFDVTEDGRYAVITSHGDYAANNLMLVDLTDDDWQPWTIVADFDNQWGVIGNVGTRFYVMTSKDAERRKLVALDISDPDAVFVDLLAEGDDVLNNAWLVGNRLITSHLVDANTQIRRYMLDGMPDGEVELPGIGSAGAFYGTLDDDEVFFVYTSFNAPTSVYRYDMAKSTHTAWSEPEVAADLDGIVVEQQFFMSADGTEMPMFIVRRKDVTGPAPTMLYGYGGFGISMQPIYNPSQLAWVEQGGVLAVANIRGGGEYGFAWHDAGRRLNKQNVFDDFIAAAEHLIARGITPSDGLAIQGESNGGLLIGAVVNQRSELFAVALVGVGVLDMLRFNKFTSGQMWAEEYGDPAVEDQFRNLLAYSPYHNIKPSEDYPAILVTTADRDDRVVPGHSFKYVAALQAANIGPMPHLARIETRAGHGAGKPTDKIIAETADMWAFAAHWTGLDVGAVAGE